MARPIENKDFKEYSLESKLQETVMKYLKTLPKCKATKISDRTQRGVSDILVCYDGKYIAIELKVGTNKPSALQESFMKEIVEAGGITGVAYNLHEVKVILGTQDEC